MSEQTAIVKQETGMERVKNYMLSPQVIERFTGMMGANAMYYLNQVLIVVANSEALQKCSPSSILISAMRAASLKLSVDPVQGQAWIIPYAGVASFQLGYKGIYELAQRTNLYRFINVFPLYEGETMAEDRMTGMHKPQGQRTGDKVLGYCLYFQLFNGFEKTFYMTVAEIENHAQHYSPGNYNNGRSAWNKDNGREREKMMKKTVMTNGLRKWGRFNQGDADLIDQIEENTPYRMMDVPAEEDTTPPAVVTHTAAQNLAALGYDEPEPAKVAPVVVKSAPVAEAQPEPALLEQAEAIPAAAVKPEPDAATHKAMMIRFGHNILGETEPAELQKIITNTALAASLRRSAELVYDYFAK